MYVALAVASALLFGVWQFAIGHYRGRVPRELVLLACCLTSATAYYLLGVAGSEFVLDSGDILSGLLGGLLNVGGTLVLLKAYELGKMGVVTGVAATYALVPLAYSFLLGESLTTASTVGLLVVIAGLVVFYLPTVTKHSPGETSSLASIALALMAAALWGLAVIVLALGTRESVTGTMFVSQIPQILVALVIAFLIKRLRVGVPRRSVPVIMAAGVAVALAQVAFFTAANEGNIGVVSVLGSLSPLVTAILALVILRERMARLEVLALVIVVAGTALIAA